MKLIKKTEIFILITFLFFLPVNGEEKEIFEDEHEINFYSGMFDFSDDGKKSSIFGFQHQNENLFRDSFLGTISPITGAMITADNAGYVYTGIQAQYKIGNLNFTPTVGDPLVDTQLIPKIKRARNYKQIRDIFLYTNGILLDRIGYTNLLHSGLSRLAISTFIGSRDGYKKYYGNDKGYS